MIILAPAEHGKTEILTKFKNIESVCISADFNGYIFSDIARDMESGKIKTIMIPDFLRIVKKKHSTQANALTTISSITEEGWRGKLPSGYLPNKVLRANVITALTQDELKDKRHKWAKTGFLSRFLPVSYSYNVQTKNRIRDYIRTENYTQEKAYDFKLPEPTPIHLNPDNAQELQSITLEIVDKENILGFRIQRQLQVLAKANALMNQRSTVTNGDVQTIKELTKLVNFSFNQI